MFGPFLKLVLCDLSRQRVQGRQPRLAKSLTDWRGNPRAIGFYAIILLLFAGWGSISMVLVAPPKENLHAPV